MPKTKLKQNILNNGVEITSRGSWGLCPGQQNLESEKKYYIL